MALTLISRGARAAIFTLTRTTTSWEWAKITTSNNTGTRIPAGTYLVRMDDAGGVFGKVRFNIGNKPTDITVDGEKIVTLSGEANMYVEGATGIGESQLGAVGTLLLTPVTPLSLSLSLVAALRAWRGGHCGANQNHPTTFTPSIHRRQHTRTRQPHRGGQLLPAPRPRIPSGDGSGDNKRNSTRRHQPVRPGTLPVHGFRRGHRSRSGSHRAPRIGALPQRVAAQRWQRPRTHGAPRRPLAPAGGERCGA